MDLEFKRGSIYTRKSIGEICFPGVGRPAGGSWDTGYVSVENNLIIFMNIGIAGRTGHDFDNKFDKENNIITWYGKPNTHSKQPTFKKLVEGRTIPHFFARWDQRPEFTYLGVGSILGFQDEVYTKEGSTIELKLVCKDAKDIIGYSTTLGQTIEKPQNEFTTPPSSFVLEKHLEDYICRNWDTTSFGQNYNIYENGRQFQTDTGPIDILTIRNDSKEFRVIELKKGRASDAVVGQIQRYMGYIKDEVAALDQKVKGTIIALDNDIRIKRALRVNQDIDFYKYKIDFRLEKPF